MNNLHLLAAFILMATVTAGLLKVLLLPNRLEKLLALQLLGTTTVAVMLLISHGLSIPGLRDLALITGLLAAIIAVAFVRYASRSIFKDGQDS